MSDDAPDPDPMWRIEDVPEEELVHGRQTLLAFERKEGEGNVVADLDALGYWRPLHPAGADLYLATEDWRCVGHVGPE